MATPNTMVGNYRRQLDDKNRVSIPPKYRTMLGADPYCLPGKDGCLYIVPQNSFMSMFADYVNPNPYFSESNELTTVIFANSVVLEEDNLGRVMFDKNVKEKYGFKKEVVFVGKISFVEVWPAEVWDEKYGVLDPTAISKMIEALKNKGV